MGPPGACGRAPQVSERFNAAAFFVDRHLTEGRADRPAFRYRGRSVTYRELAEQVNRAGRALAALGVEMEQRVLIALDDSPAFAAVFWGAAKIGAVAVPVNPATRPEEIAFLLEDSRARVAVVEPGLAPAVVAAQPVNPWLRAVVVAGHRAPAGTASLDALMEKAAGDLAPAPTVAEDVLYWGYTSGSTGRPKAAVHLHEDFVAAADLVGVGVFGLGPDDLVFSVSKMSFAFGLGNSLYFPQRVGAASVLVPERLEPARVFEVVAAERPTVLFAVATVYARMLQVPRVDRRALDSLRLCVSSGEALPPAVFDAWRERFGLELLDVVGSTEALHDFLANRPGAVRRGSAGQVIPGFEARLVDDEGRPVPTGAVGHLLVKGPTTAPYYWRRRQRTRATMLGEWLRTGDMFWQDADGYFYFAGRADDMLKVGGQWVAPAEVEAALMAHPAVMEAAVVGRPDAEGLTRPAAFVVLAPGRPVEAPVEDRLRAFARERLPGFKVPAWIEVVDELPRTVTGKVQRFRLRG
jgi:benzoate-CoA ligase family protein